MDELAELLGDARREHRVRVAEPAHRDARGEVEVARAGHVPDLAAAAALEHDRLLAVVLEEDVIGEREEVGLRRHEPGVPPRGDRATGCSAPDLRRRRARRAARARTPA